MAVTHLEQPSATARARGAAWPVAANLAALAIAVALAIAAALAIAPLDARAGDIYGDLVLRDYGKDRANPEERPIGGMLRIVAEGEKHRVVGYSRPGATYYLSLPHEARYTIRLRYRDHDLATEITAGYAPTRYDLYVETYDGFYRLTAKATNEHHTRPQDKDR